KLQARYPDDFILPGEELLAWHRAQATACQESHLWRAAAVHLDRLLTARPDDATAWRDRGNALAEQGNWTGALRDYRKAAELAPDVADNWVNLAGLELHQGNTAAYRKACREMLARFRNTPDTGAANNIALACSLAPGAAGDAAK